LPETQDSIKDEIFSDSVPEPNEINTASAVLVLSPKKNQKVRSIFTEDQKQVWYSGTIRRVDEANQICSVTYSDNITVKTHFSELYLPEDAIPEVSDVKSEPMQQTNSGVDELNESSLLEILPQDAADEISVDVVSQESSIDFSKPSLILPTEGVKVTDVVVNVASWSSLSVNDSESDSASTTKKAKNIWEDFRTKKVAKEKREKDIKMAEAEKLHEMAQKEEEDREKLRQEAEQLRLEAEREAQLQQEARDTEIQARLQETARQKEAARARREAQAANLNMLSQKEMMDDFQSGIFS